MTKDDTGNNDETFMANGTEYTITQNKSTGFWSVSSPRQRDTKGNEAFGSFTTKAEIKYSLGWLG